MKPIVRRIRRRNLLKKNKHALGAFLVRALFLFVLLAIALGGGAGVGVYAYYAKDLVSPEAMAKRDIARSTKIYDRNGVLLYEVFDPQGGRRTTVPLSQMPEHLINATIATEDANFYSNAGVNIRGMMRGAYQTLSGAQLQGGSSITQQLVKNVLIPQAERMAISPERKIKEIILAYELTRRYSKDQILEWYLNEINYGNLSYGIEAAAESYFGKKAKDLNLAESSMLAGLPQAPGFYAPLSNPKSSKNRQADVLDLMVRQGYITQAEAEKAKKEELNFKPQRFDIKAPHFVMYVREILEKKYGADALYRGGLKVTTTLDYSMQENAEWIAREQVKKLKAQNANNAALVAMRPQTGEILTMLGSVDYFDKSISGQVNVATSERQPGSSFKPLTYLTAFMKGYAPATMLLDVRTSFKDGVNPPYVPENVDGKFRGPVRLRQALSNSLNIPAVQAIQYASLKDVLDTAHRMGITTLNRKSFYGLSLTLGGGEVKLLDLVYAYSVFANGGLMTGQPIPRNELTPGMRELEPVAILEVVNGEGKVLERYQSPSGKEIFPPQQVYQITDILSDNETRAIFFGSNNPLKLSRPAAAKTGTTNDYRDNWTLGYTPSLVAGVWVGNTDNQPMIRSFGSTAAAPIWHDFMEAALKNAPVEHFDVPEGIEKVEVCSISGEKPSQFCPTKATDVFVKGAEPTNTCSVHQAFRIDKTTGLLATSNTPPENIEEKVFLVLPPQAADWVRENNIPQPPFEYTTGAMVGDIVITSPSTGAYLAGPVAISGSAKGDEFANYVLEYGEGTSPAMWKPVGQPHGEAVGNGRLEGWDTVGLNGLFTLRLTVSRHNGAISQASIPVNVDNITPTVKMSYPSPGLTIARISGRVENVGIQADATDNTGITKVEFFIDDKSIGFTSVAPYNRDWKLASGEHTVYAVAWDRAGNSTTSPKVTFKVN